MPGKASLAAIAAALLFVLAALPTDAAPTTKAMPRILPSKIPFWTEGQAGEVQLEAKDGQPIHCDPVAVDAPGWIHVGPTCLITGVAPLLAPGTTKLLMPPFAVRVYRPTLAGDLVAYKDAKKLVAITILEVPPAFTTGAMTCTAGFTCAPQFVLEPDGPCCPSYQVQLAKASTLPSGLKLDRQGRISGTPKASLEGGSFSIGICEKASRTTCSGDPMPVYTGDEVTSMTTAPFVQARWPSTSWTESSRSLRPWTGRGRSA